MKLLVVGSNGSEHALCWKLKQSPRVSEVFVTPGNAGMANVATVLGITSKDEIVAWVKLSHVDLVVVRADNYIASGLTDDLRAAQVTVFGPSKAAAQIEWSKAFAKSFMKEEGIPTAQHETFTSYVGALQRVSKMPHPIVIKADGLALGKGVVISKTLDESKETLRAFMNDDALGESGRTVVVEEFLVGREFSVHAFCTGTDAVLFPPSQDHKRIHDNDEGPNTGGMGTVAPLPWVTNADMRRIKEEIVLPTLRALARRGTPFSGLLFPGIMLTEEGPKVIEFNARFGDPETQTYMRLLESDLADVLMDVAHDDVQGVRLKWHTGAAATVMLASKGYPSGYEIGLEIAGIEDAEADQSVVVFHSGTARLGDTLVTKGGRVLGVSAVGGTLAEALESAYAAAGKIHFTGAQYRRDIGRTSL